LIIPLTSRASFKRNELTKFGQRGRYPTTVPLVTQGRGFRTLWWHGFSDGVEAKLARELRNVERSNPGAALVLRDRTQRAEEEMIRIEPNLVLRANRYSKSGNAYNDWRRAEWRFSSDGDSVQGGQTAIPGVHETHTGQRFQKNFEILEQNLRFAL
jgi:hypothetical protein